MIKHSGFSPVAFLKCIKRGEITLAGNVNSRIYGRLHCVFGKRMSKQNRVFFESPQQAVNHGFRPCGHCLKANYIDYKKHLDPEGLWR